MHCITPLAWPVLETTRIFLLHLKTMSSDHVSSTDLPKQASARPSGLVHYTMHHSTLVFLHQLCLAVLCYASQCSVASLDDNMWMIFRLLPKIHRISASNVCLHNCRTPTFMPLMIIAPFRYSWDQVSWTILHIRHQVDPGYTETIWNWPVMSTNLHVCSYLENGQLQFHRYITCLLWNYSTF